MSVLKKLVLVMLVALWVPATSHCLLAALSGLESLECCSEESSPECSPCHENECAENVCTTVEAGYFKTETAKVAAPQPLFNSVLFEHESLDAEPAFSALTHDTVSVPPELFPTQHFRTRAVLPARAPTSFY